MKVESIRQVVKEGMRRGVCIFGKRQERAKVVQESEKVNTFIFEICLYGGDGSVSRKKEELDAFDGPRYSLANDRKNTKTFSRRLQCTMRKKRRRKCGRIFVFC